MELRETLANVKPYLRYHLSGCTADVTDGRTCSCGAQNILDKINNILKNNIFKGV